MQTSRVETKQEPISLAFVISKLDSSQLTWEVIHWANEKCSQDPLFNFMIFYEELGQPCLVPLFAVMPTSEMYLYEGTLIATSLSTARKVLSAKMNSAQKYFLVWDLEWTRAKHTIGSTNFREFQEVYGSKELQLLARSESHANVIKTWNERVKVCAIKDIVNVVGK